MKKKIFIAVDTNKVKLARKILKHSYNKKIKFGYKFGLEFINSKNGRNFISKIKNKEIWLDLKLLDIPNTVYSAIFALKDLKNLNYLTIHTSGGLQMMKTAKKVAKKTNKKLKVLGVTVLTSFTNHSLKQTGHTKKINEVVKKQTKLAKLAGLDGIVCSGLEAKYIRKFFKKEIITPGIRLKGDKKQDQKRIVTPKIAFKNGATGIVMGRSLVKGNIRANINRLIQSLN